MSDAVWVANALCSGQTKSTPQFAPWFTSPQQASEFHSWAPAQEAVDEPAELIRPTQNESQSDEVTSDDGPDASGKPAKAAAPAVGISELELDATRAQAFAEGLAEGRAQVMKKIATDQAQREALCKAVASQWQVFKRDTDLSYEPLKRLSLHIAEQLVRAELKLSGEAIVRLIQQCAEQLDQAYQGLVVALNEKDLARMHKMKVQWPKGWRFEASAQMSEGSVRLTTDDAEVEDLMEHRLAAMAEQLLGPAASGKRPHSRWGETQGARAAQAQAAQDVESDANAAASGDAGSLDELDTSEYPMAEPHTHEPRTQRVKAEAVYPDPAAARRFAPAANPIEDVNVAPDQSAVGSHLETGDDTPMPPEIDASEMDASEIDPLAEYADMAEMLDTDVLDDEHDAAHNLVADDATDATDVTDLDTAFDRDIDTGRRVDPPASGQPQPNDGTGANAGDPA